MRLENNSVRKAWLLLGLFAMVGTASFSSDAFAQSSRDISNRLSRIENEIETLNRAVYRGEAPPPSALSADPAASAAAEVRLQQLEIELRDIRGALEEQNYKLRQVNDDMQRAISDMELRLNELEGGRTNSANAGGAPYTSSNSTMKTVQPSQPVGTGAQDSFTWNSNAGQSSAVDTTQTLGGQNNDAAALYENSFSLLKNSNYEAAGQGFETFITKYPSHQLVGNAKYWLGETYYVRGKYEPAARIFAEGYQQFPQGTKAADNLLKLGMSLGALGSTNDACVALAQLKKEFSSGSSPVIRRADQEIARLNCP